MASTNNQTNAGRKAYGPSYILKDLETMEKEIPWIFSINPMLSSAISTGWTLYDWWSWCEANKQIPGWVWTQGTSSYEVSIDSTSELDHPASQVQTINSGTSNSEIKISDLDQILSKSKTSVVFIPKGGWFMCLWNRRLFSFNKIEPRKDSNNSNGDIIPGVIVISCTPPGKAVIKQLLEEARALYQKPDNELTWIYVKGESRGWKLAKRKSRRPLSTVILDKNEKLKLVKDIERYLNPSNRKRYENRGTPYRRGYLLHGPPGTGKTSLCLAIAGRFGLSVYMTSINGPNMNDDVLASMFSAIGDGDLVLLEDIDSAGISQDRDAAAGTDTQRSTGGRSNGVTLSGLLNVIDGPAAPEGQILMMTTNHIEQLDPALIRPGRVDHRVKFQNANFEILKDMFQWMYVVQPEDRYESTVSTTDSFTAVVNITAEELFSLATRFASLVPSGEFSPAQIQGYLQLHENSPWEACEGVAEWVVATRKQKKDERRQGDGEVASTEEQSEKQDVSDLLHDLEISDNS